MSKTPLSGSTNEDIGFLINSVSHTIRQRFNRLYEIHDITYPQSLVMFYLLKNQDRETVNQRRLEYALGIKASSVSSLVRNLEAKGFLYCERTVEDARNKRLRLTEKGQGIYEVLGSTGAEIERSMTDGFSAEEKDALVSMLKRVRDNLKETEPGDGAERGSTVRGCGPMPSDVFNDPPPPVSLENEKKKKQD